MSTNHSIDLDEVKRRLLRVWLAWGLLPLALSIVLTLVMDALVTGQLALTPMQMERRFQVILAIGAGLFLIAFSLDSNWTNAQKMAKKIAAEAGLDAPGPGGKPKKRPEGRSLELLLAPHAGIVINSIVGSVQALAFVGAGIAVCGILAASAHLGIGYSVMMLILALSYQLFVLSRHAYYNEVMETAVAGRLVHDLEAKQ